MTISVAECDRRLAEAIAAQARCAKTLDRRGAKVWAGRIAKLEKLRELALHQVKTAADELPRDPDRAIAAIAKAELQIDDLAPVSSDRLDFVELHKVQIADALRAAFMAGRKSAGRW